MRRGNRATQGKPLVLLEATGVAAATGRQVLPKIKLGRLGKWIEREKKKEKRRGRDKAGGM